MMFETLIKWRDDIDNAILGEIQEKATEHGISTEYILNKKAIISALKKQIPKKPKERKAGFKSFDYVCPECASRRISKIDGEWIAGSHSRYCSNCGQALDWSDTE